MKKHCKRLIAMLLAAALVLVGMPPMTSNAEAEAEPVRGYYVNFAESDFAGEKEFALRKENQDATDYSGAVQGDTWCISTTINYKSIYPWQAPFIAFAKGTYNGEENMLVRLQIRNTASNEGQYLLNCAPEPMHQYGSEITSGITGVFLETGKDYRITMKVLNGNLLKFWINGVFVTEFSLEKLGIINLKPCLGWRAYNSTGVIKNIQVWDGVSFSKDFNPATDINYARWETMTIEGPTYDEYFGDLSFGAEKTYYYSGDIDYGEGLDYANEKYGNMGVYFIIGKALIGEEEYPILAEHRPASSATRVYVKKPNDEITLGPKSYWISDLWHQQKYHYDVVWENGKVSFYVNNREVVKELDLAAKVKEELGTYGKIIPGTGIMARELPQTTTISNLRVWAEAMNAYVEYYEDISAYRKEENYTAPVKVGYVFAGWFTDEECTKAITTQTKEGSAYAKFVPEEVLSVKSQLRANGENAKDMRFVTTVDSLDYKNIGFDITINGRTLEKTSTTVYRNVLATEGGSIIYHDPTEFSMVSAWFHSFSITGIPQEAYDTDIQVTACWNTLDGTKVNGAERILTVKSAL